MNRHIAEKMFSELNGKIIGGWRITGLLNNGKSAVVFLAEKGGTAAALKVFDPEIVDRYGKSSQLARIDREKTLIGKSHPHLVQIYDGGEDAGFLFVAMEYFPGKNMAECLEDIPPPQVRSLIAQVASAAKFLEDSSLAHRDIKPSNIGISSDFKSAKLLDCGVLRPFDLSNVTDEGEQLYFIGTLQYSPPELLFREENPSIEGWRGVTFYQLGAVLHDLLMRKPLFMESTNPYARLVRAVEREIPRLDSAAADSDLRLLAQNCLSKVPSQRLDTVSWESFNQPPTADPLEMARRTIAQRRAAAASIPAISPNTEELREQQCFALRTSLDSAVVNTITSETMPRYSTRDSGTANPYLVKVLFQPSPSDGLMHYFACYFEGAIADPLTALRELKVWACIAANETLIPEHPEAARIGAALRGALIDQDVRAMVHDCLLMAYAQALDSSAAPGEIVWLPIRGTL